MPSIFAKVAAIITHKDFRIVLEKNSLEPHEFLNKKFNESWLLEIQKTIKFWQGPATELIVKTSGSTGLPKEIFLAKSVLVHSARTTINYFGLKPGNSVLHFLPCQFIGGKMLVFRAMIGGLILHLEEPKLALPTLQQSFDFVALTPAQAQMSIGQLHNFKHILLGGAPVSSKLESALQQINSNVVLGYGMTETASHVASKKLNGMQADGQFYAMPDVKFSCDERGCLVVNAPKWHAEKLVTNDVVNLKSETSFVWLGRADNVINSGGVKIYPEELERMLDSQIQAPFFISSEPDKVLGQKVVLFIEASKPFDIDFSMIPTVKKPREIRFIKQFTYTQNGKIDRTNTLKKLL